MSFSNKIPTVTITGTELINKFKAVTFRSVIAFVFIFFYLPILAITYLSFGESQSPTYPLNNYTLEWYNRVLNDSRFMEGLMTSFEIGIVVAIVGTVLGVMGAYTIIRSDLHKGIRIGLALIISLPLFVPTVVIGVSLGLFASTVGLGFGYLPVVIGHTIWVLPYSTFILTARYSEINPKLNEAASDLGASRLETFRSVTLPLLGPALFAAAIFSFVMSFNEFLITFFLAGGGMTTMPLEIFAYIKTGQSTFLNAASVLVLVISAIIALIAMLFRKPFK
jgi:spermidine/putrescine transport system permease protein